MLVLSRKKDEKIILDNTIILMVIEIRGDKVRLGIQAPGRIVHRQEVYDKILLQQEITSILDATGQNYGSNGQLVLSRKKDERIVIDDNITLMVIEIRGEKVRIGIDAPKPVPVHREEVFKAIQRERALQRAQDAQESPSP